MAGGRVEYNPLGPVKKAQGDFKRELKASVGAAAFVWANDDDNNTRTTDGTTASIWATTESLTTPDPPTTTT